MADKGDAAVPSAADLKKRLDKGKAKVGEPSITIENDYEKCYSDDPLMAAFLQENVHDVDIHDAYGPDHPTVPDDIDGASGLIMNDISFATVLLMDDESTKHDHAAAAVAATGDDDVELYDIDILQDCTSASSKRHEDTQIRKGRLHGVLLRRPPIKTGPGSRNPATDDYCFGKVLERSDVANDGMLLIDPWEATLLVGDPALIAVELPPLWYKRMLIAYDSFDRRYNMLLSVGQQVKDSGGVYYNYKLTKGWSLFVSLHGLSVGDEAVFYRHFDEKIVADDTYLILRYFRRPKPVKVIKIKDENVNEDEILKTRSARNVGI